MNELAKALRQCLISPNVPADNGEPANIVDAIDKLSEVMRFGMTRLVGQASQTDEIGAIRCLGHEVLDGAQIIARAINNLAEAIREQEPK